VRGRAVGKPVVGAAAVAHGHVEEAVGAEVDPAAVMVELRLVDREEHGADGAGDVGIGGGDGVFGEHFGMTAARGGDAGLAGQAGARARVADEEAAVGRVLRVKRQAQQAALVVACVERDHERRDVEEGRGEERAVLDDADAPGLFNDEQAPGVVGHGLQGDRRDQAGGDGAEFERVGSGGDLRGRRGCG
jgi:hypothetical protein